MGIIATLSELALRQLMGDGADVVLAVVRDRFADEGHRMLEALNDASKCAWRTLEIALAGASWWDKVKGALARREEQAFAREIQSFLDSTPLVELAPNPEYRENCLRELRQAKKEGIIPGQLSAAELARHAHGWPRLADDHAVAAAETAALAGLVEELKKCNCAWLAWLIQHRPNGGPPLLALAVRYFFHRKIEGDAELARGLTFRRLEGLTRAQAQGFHNLAVALAKNGRRVEDLLSDLRGAIDRNHDSVLDLRAEVERLGQSLQAETRALHQAVVKALEERQLHGRPVRPKDSMSIRTDLERELVKALLARYRSLPEAQRHLAPALLNGFGQLELAVGDHENAQRAFATAARLTPDVRAQAEAHYNAYRAALARSRCEEALDEIRQAVARDPGRFAPFPLEEYEPLRILGAGGFGVTFLCRNKLLGSNVAVKALAREDLERNVGLVFQEAAALDQLHHSAIIQLRHCGYADAERTRPYIAMEYFEGQSLDQYVQANGPLPWEDFKAVSRLVAEALAAAHAKDILHRDVKPANLLVRKAGAAWDVRLIDFGLALNQAAIDAASTVRQGYGVTGTLDYAAPEQLGKLPGVRVGPRADVYGFAKTCCFALFRTPQPEPRHWDSVSPSLRRLLGACLAERPTGRPASFAEVLTGLSQARPKSPPKTPRKDSGDGRQRERHTNDDAPPPRQPSAKAADPFGGGADVSKPATPPIAGPRLRVLRGRRRDVEYALREGQNYIGWVVFGAAAPPPDPLPSWIDPADIPSGRQGPLPARAGPQASAPPVINLVDQEPTGRIKSSSRHAVIVREGDNLTIEDLNSQGTFVNRALLPVGQKRPLRENDIIQIGGVQLQLKVRSG